MTVRWNTLWLHMMRAKPGESWRRNGNFKSVEEFVKSIPFTETREYVQAIMRNAVLYKLLYPSKADSKSVAENQTP